MVKALLFCMTFEWNSRLLKIRSLKTLDQTLKELQRSVILLRMLKLGIRRN